MKKLTATDQQSVTGSAVFHLLPLDKMGYLHYAHCFAPDGNGNLYISTNNDIFKVSIDAIVASIDNPQPIYYHYLGKRGRYGSDETKWRVSKLFCAITG